jgi:hypothetical protein
MQNPRWKDVREDWLPDDGLRDLNIPETDDGGQSVVEMIRARADWTTNYTENGEAVAMPEAVSMIPRRIQDTSYLWQITLPRGVVANCRFLPGLLDIDFDPREIRGQKDFDVVCDFIRAVGVAASERVEVTPEGQDDQVILSFDPATGQFTTT